MMHAFSRDLETHKARLNGQSVIEIERLRHELKVLAAETEKRSNLLLEKRAQVIAELYTKLVDFLASAQSFASLIEWSGEPSKKEKAAELADKASSFISFFHRHRIYFSGAVCEKIDEIFLTVHGPALRYRVWLRMLEDDGTTGGKLSEAWDEAWNTIQNDVPPLQRAIEAEFRVLLGVN